MRKQLLLLVLAIGLTAQAQVPTELTTFLNLPCDFTVCEDIQLGNCPEDVNSDGVPYEYTDFQVYYSDEDVNIQYNSLTLRNCRLEFRNGANLVDNDILIDIQGDCNEPNQITEIVFLGGGNRYPTVEAMNATLGIESFEVFKQKANKTYYTILGQKVDDIENQSKGIYIVEYNLNGRIEREKIIK